MHVNWMPMRATAHAAFSGCCLCWLLPAAAAHVPCSLCRMQLLLVGSRTVLMAHMQLLLEGSGSHTALRGHTQRCRRLLAPAAALSGGAAPVGKAGGGTPLLHHFRGIRAVLHMCPGLTPEQCALSMLCMPCRLTLRPYTPVDAVGAPSHSQRASPGCAAHVCDRAAVSAACCTSSPACRRCRR